MRTHASAKWVLSALVLAGGGAITPPVSAVSTGTTLLVTAVVISTCVASATPVVFGNYTLGLVDNTGVISVTCSPDVAAYTVALDQGVTGITTSSRKLTFGAGTLNYALYSDSNRSVNWGNVQNTDTVASSASTTSVGAVKTFNVYGRLPASQASVAGLYSDLVQVTVTY